MKNKLSFKGLWEVLKNSFSGFSEDKVTKLSASLAYYTVFSMGPLLIVIIYLCGIFLGREAIEGSIYAQMKGFVGKEAAEQIQVIIKNAYISDKGGIAAVIGIVTLLFGATGVFAEIQDSINGIWGLKAKPKLGIMKLLKSRLLSFGIIGSLGFLLLVSLAATTVVEGLSRRLQAIFPDVTVVIFYIINLLLTFAVVTALFAVIFKVLPDAKIKWRDVWAGAIATAVLFLIGKFLISIYISKSDVGSTYGTAGSLVIILLWIYYSSIILYFGAEFTKAYAMKYGSEIHPNEYAIVMKKVEVEEGQGSIQQGEGKKEKVKQGQPVPEYYASGVANRRPMAMQERTAPVPHWYYDDEAEVMSKKKKKEKKKGVGMMTVLGGLPLYYLNSANRQESEQKKIADVGT